MKEKKDFKNILPRRNILLAKEKIFCVDLHSACLRAWPISWSEEAKCREFGCAYLTQLPDWRQPTGKHPRHSSGDGKAVLDGRKPESVQESPGLLWCWGPGGSLTLGYPDADFRVRRPEDWGQNLAWDLENGELQLSSAVIVISLSAVVWECKWASMGDLAVAL